MTSPAREALPSNPFVIDRLPFRIGRQANDPLANNDLSLKDFEPFQVSIHHLLIFMEIAQASSGGRVVCLIVVVRRALGSMALRWGGVDG